MELRALERIDINEFRRRGAHERAVVVEGAAPTGAMHRWSPEYLGDLLGDCNALVRFGDGTQGHLPARAFFDYLENPTATTSSRGAAYLVDFYIEPSFGDARRARLYADAPFPLTRSGDEWAEWVSIYAGPAGSTTSLHQDVFFTTTWLAQIVGTKEWRLCAPEDMTSEAAGGLDPFSLAEFPCPFYAATLHPGDVMFLPPGWWHAVRNPIATIAISGNYCAVHDAEVALEHSRGLADGPHREVWINTWVAILDRVAERRSRGPSAQP